MGVRRSRLGRLWMAVAAMAAAEVVSPTEVWLPVKDGSGRVPGRYPSPGGRMVLVLYAPNDPAVVEGET